MSRLDCCPLPEFDVTGGRLIITSPWGQRREGMHYGVDWGSTDGIEQVPAYSVVPGKIVHYQLDPGVGAGLNLWFVGENGSRWKYFHLSEVNIGLINILVPAGTAIARIGNTGTGAVHLHLEEHVGKWNGQGIDFTASARECLSAGRFPGKLVPPVVESPPLVTTPVPVTETDDMILCMVYFPDKDDRWVLGLDRDGYWKRHLDNPIEIELLNARGIGARPLAVGGSEGLDALYEQAREAA